MPNADTPIMPIPECACCGWQPTITQDTGLETWTPETGMLVLPCGCTCREECLKRILSRNDECPCGFKLFRRLWTLEKWLQSLERLDTVALKDEDRCCEICREKYIDVVDTDEISQAQFTRHLDFPVKLACGHIFGHQCLTAWLAPRSSGGGGGNTCPTCRYKLFEAWLATDGYLEFLNRQANELRAEYNRLDRDSESDNADSASDISVREVTANGLEEDINRLFRILRVNNETLSRLAQDLRADVNTMNGMLDTLAQHPWLRD